MPRKRTAHKKPKERQLLPILFFLLGIVLIFESLVLMGTLAVVITPKQTAAITWGYLILKLTAGFIAVFHGVSQWLRR